MEKDLIKNWFIKVVNSDIANKNEIIDILLDINEKSNKKDIFNNLKSLINQNTIFTNDLLWSFHPINNQNNIMFI